jgi:hypothetical protein
MYDRAYLLTDGTFLFPKKESSAEIFLGDHAVVHHDQSPNTGKDQVFDRLVS